MSFPTEVSTTAKKDFWTRLPLGDKMQRPTAAILLVLSNELYSKWHREKGKLNVFNQDNADDCALNL